MAGPDARAPIVLIPGILQAPSSWDAVARLLRAEGREVLQPDLGGPSRGGSWGPEAVAEDAQALLREAAPAGAHLVGASRGATVASWVAVEAPGLVRSLAVVASPPQATEAFRATFRRKAERLGPEGDARVRGALRYLATIPDDAFPTHALRRYEGRALVVEAEDDPLYSPTSTLFWRAFLPYADFERIPGGHTFYEEPEGARWLAARLFAHVSAASSP